MLKGIINSVIWGIEMNNWIDFSEKKNLRDFYLVNVVVDSWEDLIE